MNSTLFSLLFSLSYSVPHSQLPSPGSRAGTQAGTQGGRIIFKGMIKWLMIIAMDGPAGAGKSTLAGTLARKLKLTYVNSGNIYRAITYAALKNDVNIFDEKKLLDFARKLDLDYCNESVFVNRENITKKLHSDKVDRNVSAVSSVPAIRHIVNDIIRQIARNRDVVVEGRDMTTVVFPNARHRFYIDASLDVRAERRFEQGVTDLSLDGIKMSLIERDEQDKAKKEGSLRLGPGVEYIDTSRLTLDQSCEKLLNKIQNKGYNMVSLEVDNGKSAQAADSQKSGARNENQTQMQEEFLKSLEQLEEGQIVSGIVVQVNPDQVFVDIGYKSEGKIPISEFSEPPNVGDEVKVVLVIKENKRGEVIVSKQKADEKIALRTLKTASMEHLPIEGTIKKMVKGGFEVDLGGIAAFLPVSQADKEHVENPETLVGLKIRAYVERMYSEGKLNVVVNRRKLLEEELNKKRDDFIKNTPVGTEIDGVVKSFTSFGAFVDIGGFDGLLHINDMSWGHVVRPKDFVKKGQNIRVKVLKLEPEEKRINLSLKHFTDDPWVHFEDKYHVNDIVKGTITKIAEFGAFIELEEGIEGLAHISEFSWVKKVQKPEEVLKIGDTVECMILGYDIQAGRVSLGLKQVTANPWETIEERYPVGTRLKRKVVKASGFGALIELEDGIYGYLHGDDLSWTKKIKHISNELKAGEEIDVIVIKVDGKTKNVKLGVKQLTEDPWKSFAAAYKTGSIAEGEVSSVQDFGLFIKMPGGIEGLIHKSNLVQSKEEDPEEQLKKYNVGDKIKAVIVELQPEKQKLSFSLRDYQKKLEQEEMSRYMAKDESGDSTFTLGDVLKSKAENQS